MTLSLLAMLGAASSCSRVSVRFAGSANSGSVSFGGFDGCDFAAFAGVKHELHVDVSDGFPVVSEFQTSFWD